MRRAAITGWGRCTPSPVLTNDDLASVMDTSDEWITARSGIKERRVSHVENSDMAALAGRRAMAAAGVETDDIDYVLVATCTGDRQIPAMACHVQAKLGTMNAAALDVNAGCTGFIYGLNLANGLIATGAAERILLIGSERITPFLDLDERSTAVLFGDGAGAAVIEPARGDEGLRSINVGADGTIADVLTCQGMGSSYIGVPPVPVRILMDGREVFRNAVTGMAAAAERAIAEAGWSADDVAMVFPHQANIRIIDATTKRLGVDEAKVYTNIASYGNTSAASIPIAMSEALDEGRVSPGDKLILVAFGAGLTWGAAAVVWGDRVTPVATTDAELPATDQTGLDIVLQRQKVRNA
jgi:3-oxoacyl-[acyl-carrier-protein] synthase III